jgi:hypothetical protein
MLDDLKNLCEVSDSTKEQLASAKSKLKTFFDGLSDGALRRRTIKITV